MSSLFIFRLYFAFFARFAVNIAREAASVAYWRHRLIMLNLYFYKNNLYLECATLGSTLDNREYEIPASSVNFLSMLKLMQDDNIAL
jgi:hypothetical protein